MGIVTTHPATWRAAVAVGARAERPNGGRSTDARGPAERAPGSVTSVVIVDDHIALSGALAITIDAYPDLRCVGTAATLAAARPLVERLAPDVVLLDVRLPDGNGIDAIPDLAAARPGVRVLVLTGHTDVDMLSRAASFGASGFLPKESPVSAVIGAIRASVAGQMLVDGPTLAAILGRVKANRGAAEDRVIPDRRLTSRELSVLALMRQGLDTHAIAVRLGISLNTCRGHQKSILAKLEAHSQLEAVVVAARMGLIQPLES